MNEDILQEVFTSIFVRVRQGTFHCDTDDRLWQLLCIRALKRLRAELRRHWRLKRDVPHEEQIGLPCADDDHAPEALADPHAGAEQLVDDRDELLAVVETLDDERSKILVYLRLDNYTLEEIADLTQWSLRTIKRLWKGVRKRCERWRRDHEDT